ncbi:MAG: hypothetical protein IT370_34505 [Deltaproteobacteria bacterium]|nr:hypothetical protein [Deltaproteobacteria bacterium]
MMTRTKDASSHEASLRICAACGLRVSAASFGAASARLLMHVRQAHAGAARRGTIERVLPRGEQRARRQQVDERVSVRATPPVTAPDLSLRFAHTSDLAEADIIGASDWLRLTGSTKGRGVGDRVRINIQVGDVGYLLTTIITDIDGDVTSIYITGASAGWTGLARRTIDRAHRATLSAATDESTVTDEDRRFIADVVGEFDHI